MDVPPFLLPTFKQLTDHGYDIRRIHGRETKRYVKFDDERLSLILEVRLPSSTKWIRISPEQARTYFEEKDQIDYGSLRRDLLRAQRNARSEENPNLIPIGRAGASSASMSSTESLHRLQSSTASQPNDSSKKKKWTPPSRITRSGSQSECSQ